ncbi:MAG: alpha/beta fold hydrolase [Pseudomonadota bacterium]
MPEQDPRAPLRDWVDLTRRMAVLSGQFSQSDLRAVAIATTPKTKIAEWGKITLSRYCPVVESPSLGPLLIVHGLIGRQTVTDLQPDRSLVRRLIEAGVDLYVIDWGNPSRADRCRDFTDYADIALSDALDAIAEVSGARRAALFGICQGGVFGLCHAALYPERLSGLALAVTPVDFHADTQDPEPTHGFLNVWARGLPAELIDGLVDDVGNLSGRLTGAVFETLTPARTFAKYTADLFEIADDREALQMFLRMEKWLADRPDHPGAAAKQWLGDLYRENRLVRGTFALDGERVDLGRIACPVLTVIGRDDHIVPPPCARAVKAYLRNAPYREVEVPTGHIGVFVSRKAQQIVPPAVVSWLQGVA